MSPHRLSFTEKRRRKLALRVARLDRLETRNTITEPISVTALSVSALRGLVQLGIMSADGGHGAALSRALAAQAARQAQIQARRSAPRLRDALAIDALRLARHHSGGSGGAATAPAANNVKRIARQGLPADWLKQTFGQPADSGESHGISSPWQPARRPGGGAALPGRGGSGSGA
jgi:hypothetical protein